MASTEAPGSLRQFTGALTLVSCGLNWIWEMVQMPAYAEMAGRAWRDTMLRCTLAAAGDVVATVAVVGIGSLAAGQMRWVMTGKWNVYATATLLGAAIAILLEL